MTVTGIAMVRDEIDIIESTVTHMAHQCDRLLIADNGSTDGTRELLDDLPCDVLDDLEPAYFQSRKMSTLACAAFDEGADWVVPFDADERWYGEEGRIAPLLESLPGEAMICEATVLDHVATGDKMSTWDPLLACQWRRREALPLRKVACRAEPALVIHQGNHGATYPDLPYPLTVTGKLQVRHFPYRSVEQFIHKVRNGAAAYEATDLPEEVGAHWRSYGKLSDSQLAEVFYKWFHVTDPENDPELLHDPAPVLSKL